MSDQTETQSVGLLRRSQQTSNFPPLTTSSV